VEGTPVRVEASSVDPVQGAVVNQVFWLSPARVDTSYDEHAAIAAAVIDRDGNRAAELLIRHLELGKRLILSPRS
jgi:DNA-binding GntR family transcriptional regulator